MSLNDPEDGPPLACAVVVSREADTESPPPPHGYEPQERSSLDDPLLQQLMQMNSKLDTIDQRSQAQSGGLASLAQEIRDLKDAGTATSLGLSLLLDRPVPNGLTDCRVLVVEDNEDLLNYTEQMLKAHGCHVFATDSKRAAEEVLQTARGRRAFQVALVDLHLPHRQDGLDLISWISAVSPTVKTVVTSGLPFRDVPELDRLPVIRLQKQFTADQLVDSIYAAIGHYATGADTERPDAPPAFEPETETTTQPSTGRETPEAKANDDAASGSTTD